MPPPGDFYATITGPNYDGTYKTFEHFGEELADQIKCKKQFETSKLFLGMTDDELLANVPVLKEMGFIL